MIIIRNSFFFVLNHILIKNMLQGGEQLIFLNVIVWGYLPSILQNTQALSDSPIPNIIIFFINFKFSYLVMLW